MYAATEEAVTYELADCADRVKLIGRAEVTQAGIVPHTTASGIAFYSDCGGTIEMTIYGSDNLFDAQYFIVYVDGEIYNRVTLDHKRKGNEVTDTLVMAEDLEQGMHRIEILRETEEINAYCRFVDITLNGTMTPVAQAPMLIEFIGDSITTGYGAYPQTAQSALKQESDHPIRQAGTKSYAYLTGQALGMDIQVCCTSGYGVEVGWNGYTNLQEMYEYTAYHHDHSSDSAKWSFERTADVVVINLGTNDSSARTRFGVTEAQVLAGIKNMMQLVREKNPDAKIVWVTGMMGTTFKNGTIANVEELGGADAGYYFCELPLGTSGGGGHPNEEEHAAAAQVLTEFLLETVLPDEYASSYVTADEMKSLLSYASMVPGSDYDIGMAEWRSATASGNLSGTMTTVYQTLQSQVITAAIIAGAILLAIIAGLVLFAVLYKPKKKTSAADAQPAEE